MQEAATRYTRQDIAGYLGNVFDRFGIVHRDNLLRVLAENDAPGELVDLVAARVPVGSRFPDMRTLWTYLRDVPLA